MKNTIITLFLLQTLFTHAQYEDFSKHEEYEPLDGLLINAIDLEKLEDSTITIFDGPPLTVKRYSIKSKIVVQLACYFIEGEFEKATANYLIEIAVDTSGSIRKQFADQIYNYWMSKTESYLDNYEFLPALNHIFYESGDYVMYLDSEKNRESYQLLYFNDKILKVTFKGLEESKGWGGLSSFLSEVVQFNFETRTIHPSYKSTFNPKEFIRLYKRKVFE